MAMTRKSRLLAEEAFRLHVIEGMSQRQVAEKIERALSTTNRMLRRLEDEWHEELTSEVYRIKVRQTQMLELIAREAMAGWQRSIQNEESEKLVAFAGEEAGKGRKEKMSKRQAGDPSFLSTAMKALADIREIWGMDAPQKLQHTGKDGKLFDSDEQNLLSDPRVAELTCLMEERLQEVENSRGSANAPGADGSDRGPSTDHAVGV